MKKLMKQLALSLLFAACGFGANAQNYDFKRVQDAQEITWYGIDYTKNKLVGLPVDFKNLTAIVNNYYGSINNLFLSEPSKYDIAGAVNKKINFKIETALLNVSKIDTTTLVTVERNAMPLTEVQEVIKQYKSTESCVGMSMVMVNFDKPMRMVRLYLVFFDPSTSEILFAKYYETPISGGFGFRNYYASGVYQTIKKIDLEYPTWGQATIK